MIRKDTVPHDPFYRGGGGKLLEHNDLQIYPEERLVLINQPDAVAGDVLLNGNDGLIFARFSDDPDQESIVASAYTPVGVVVIPTNHNVYGDGSCGVMSLRGMSTSSPDEGVASNSTMYWGGYGTDTSLPNLNVVCYMGTGSSLNEDVQGTYSYTYLPSDRFSAVDNPYDPGTGYYSSSNSYYQAPSPYKADGSRNPAYYQTSSPSSSANALADFDGIGNSGVLWGLATSQSDWKTASNITNGYASGYYPPACCCWRFHTVGTEQGDWYLPACGELGYIMPRFNKINETITNLVNAYGSSVGATLSTGNFYWSSSEYSSIYARRVDTNYGRVYSTYKNGDGGYVRAFARIFSNNQPVKILPTIPQSKAKVGDVALYDTQKQEIVFAHSTDLTSEFTERYSPVGVVVIPTSHNVYGNGKCGVMSLREMSTGSPDEGVASHTTMYWGGYGTDISQLDNLNVVCYVGSNGNVGESVIGTYSYAYLPSDNFSTVDNPYDPGTGYYYNNSDRYIPSPYKSDGSFNTEYSRTSSPSSAQNAMADFDGIGNATVLWGLATSQSDWKTASSITNNGGAGYYPAACCCWRFHTEGTKQGDWYLPACGELGYIMPRFNKIQETITNLRNAYGSSIGVTLVINSYYWSSSEYSSYDARRVSTSIGRVGSTIKNYNCYVRAFIQL